MTLPCENCITYAICKTKEIVECEILWVTDKMSHEDIFKKAKDILPNLISIKYGTMYVSKRPPHYHTKVPS